jgi:nucleotide-binding universal stress UspA family protein
MTEPTQTKASATTRADAPFPRVLVGIDGSRTSLHAARQAAVLAPDARIRLLAVTWEQGHGATATAVLSRWRAEDTLAHADRDLRELGVRPEVEIVDDIDATGRLLREAAGHDLLVLGGHARSRTGGVLVGDTATAALHRTQVPLLIARPLDDPHRLLDRILLAVDGSEPSLDAARITAALARRRRVGDIAIIAPREVDPPARHVLAASAAEIRMATGVEPVVLDEDRPGHRAIVRGAAEQHSTLIVMGSRGLHGAYALRSVSEHVGHEAPCSVLVMHGPLVWP